MKAAVEFVTNDIENLISDRLQTEQKILQQRFALLPSDNLGWSDRHESVTKY
ncbi:MAG: hypothetical protein KME60_16830 [Cyanomargarita calcarea GSE-NOS-MK-12-04C]|uniref:Uncharacterized protein n=1 Tax=Cyanomargarita calcarea GSE-NOS-MK-12-04C TaxID=2839659 RepID=A0A951QQ14_9CYAN|nr:hypothetical protein [Cyanomargarita calcarea GSE-NOS-MK-12-04C]